MPLALTSTDPAAVAPAPAELIDAYVSHLTRTGRVDDARYRRAAERFLSRWPDPMAWAVEPLAVRRQAHCEPAHC